MTLAWDPGDPVQITPHFCVRWRERVSLNGTDAEIAAAAISALRSLPAGTGDEKPGKDGLPALYVPVAVDGWTAKLVPALGDGWVAHTVTRRHRRQTQTAKTQRVERRAWSLWLEWCRSNGVSPIGDGEALQRLGDELDGKITAATRRIPAVARKATAEAFGCTTDQVLAEWPRSVRRTATGKEVRW